MISPLKKKKLESLSDVITNSFDHRKASNLCTDIDIHELLSYSSIFLIHVYTIYIIIFIIIFNKMHVLLFHFT